VTLAASGLSAFGGTATRAGGYLVGPQSYRQYEPVDAWPGSAEELVRMQERLAQAAPQGWHLPERPFAIGGCFVCFERGPAGPGRKGEPAWAAAAAVRSGRVVATTVVRGEAGAAYEAGLLAPREGASLAAAVRALAELPDVLLVDATGRDHPRRAAASEALMMRALRGSRSIGARDAPARSQAVMMRTIITARTAVLAAESVAAVSASRALARTPPQSSPCRRPTTRQRDNAEPHDSLEPSCREGSQPHYAPSAKPTSKPTPEAKNGRFGRRRLAVARCANAPTGKCEPAAAPGLRALKPAP
jgi:deoxyribonuclease V